MKLPTRGGAFSGLAIDNLAITERPEPDTDGDGIPDAIETLWGLNNTTNDAALDLDRDRQSNYAEFVAGTTGADSNDVLRATVSRSGSNEITVAPSHTTAPRLYILEHTADLQGEWKAVDATQTDTPVPVVFGRPADTPTSYYQIRIVETP